MVKYLLKLTPKREYGEDLLQGKLFMRPASYYHKLELGQGDPCEGIIFKDVALFKNINWPIYCMVAVEESDIIDGKIFISERLIHAFGCENGYIVIIECPYFEERLPSINHDGYRMGYGKVDYKIINISDSQNFLKSCDRHLFVKHPDFSYQKEYRILIENSVYEYGKEVKDSVEYRFPSPLKEHGEMVAVSDLDRVGNEYELNLSTLRIIQ